jgi:hypothetical protein
VRLAVLRPRDVVPAVAVRLAVAVLGLGQLAQPRAHDERLTPAAGKRSQMSAKEKTEVIRKVGHREYLNLDW